MSRPVFGSQVPPPEPAPHLPPLKRVRRPVQIAVCVVKESPSLVALCDDGTMWGYDNGWEKITAIPQDEKLEGLTHLESVAWDLENGNV